ncbi:MAG TPA: 30S ribosomal protein S17 [Candidatus Paceibacterota bacterium]|nr:30S ribosomal protein S17 [Candidatus Paceibacterota bacterium]
MTAQNDNQTGVRIRTLRGTVVSDKMDKTIRVRVTRLKMNEKYKKQYKVSETYYAHDPENAYRTGETVTIRASRPLSKTKRWVVVPKTEAAA